MRIFTYKLATEANTYQPASSPVRKMPYFVARVGLVGCALELLGRIGLGLGLVFGCMICKYVCVCVSRCTSTTITSVTCSSRQTLPSTLSSTASFDVSSAVVSTPAAAPHSSPKVARHQPPPNSTHSTLPPPFLLPATPTNLRLVPSGLQRRRDQRSVSVEDPCIGTCESVHDVTAQFSSILNVTSARSYSRRPSSHRTSSRTYALRK